MLKTGIQTYLEMLLLVPKLLKLNLTDSYLGLETTAPGPEIGMKIEPPLQETSGSGNPK